MEETVDYYRELREAIGKGSMQQAGFVPQKKQKNIEYPEPPPILIWAQRVEKYGLMVPGTWLKQPSEFMEDVEAAILGRSKADQEARGEQPLDIGEISRRIQDAFKSAPAAKPLATRG